MLYPTWINDESAIKWDTFVHNHPFGWVCHLSAWKCIIENSFKHIKGNLLALIDDENNEIVAGIPVYNIKSWLTGNRIICAPFATICDPLISSNEHFQYLFDEIVKLYEKENTKFVEIRTLNSTALIENKQLYRTFHYKNHYLSLQKDLKEIKSTFHRTCVRKNINRAISCGLVCRKASSSTDLKIFYNLLLKTRKNLGLPMLPFRFFQSIWDYLSKSENVVILIAENGQTPVAAMLLFRFKDRLSADYLGWDRNFDHMRPSVYIYWEAIKYAHEQGMKIFDFGRTSVLNESLNSFKARWNSKVADFAEFYFPATNTFEHQPKEMSNKYNFFMNTSKIAPLFIFKMMSEFCYRHLG